jgi:hypothetical protein
LSVVFVVEFVVLVVVLVVFVVALVVFDDEAPQLGTVDPQNSFIYARL